VLEDDKSVNSVSEGHGVHPNLILSWKKQLFEGAMKTFYQKRFDISERAAAHKTKELEETLQIKDTIIAQLAQELLELKKSVLVGTLQE
jgi:transposase-like protein